MCVGIDDLYDSTGDTIRNKLVRVMATESWSKCGIKASDYKHVSPTKRLADALLATKQHPANGVGLQVQANGCMPAFRYPRRDFFTTPYPHKNCVLTLP